MFVKNPAFTAVDVLTLALGVGAATAIFHASDSTRACGVGGARGARCLRGDGRDAGAELASARQRIGRDTDGVPDVDKAARLRALHHGPPILVLPNAWDAATARLVEAEGFPAVATTSAGVAAALGYPDGGAVPAREMIEAVSRIARAVTVPVTADIEHGYAATPDAVADVVLRVVAAGAVGVNLEDILPGSADLEAVDVQCDKIRAVIKAGATAGVAVVVNARTDVYLQAIGPAESRLSAAVDRGRAYLAAGAEGGVVSGAEVAQ